jgi:hypothetical protein
MTIVWPVIVSVRHGVTAMSERSSSSAGVFRSEVAAEPSICPERRSSTVEFGPPLGMTSDGKPEPTSS